MAQSKTKKKTSAVSKKAARPAPKAAARKPVAKAAKPAAKSTKVVAKGAKVAAKKVAPAKKAVPAKTVKKGKTAKPIAKPVASRSAAKTSKPAAKPAAVAKKIAKPAPRRAVAASHRPQASAVAVQPRPARKAGAAATSKPAAAPGAEAERVNGATLTDETIRKAPESAYMNEEQLAFFGERLIQMRNEVLARELDVKERLHQREVFADPADRASAEEEHWLDLRLRERESLLLKKIDDALRRIRDKDYGFCEKTGEPIGIARLLARPTATVCVDIKGQDERAESQFRDR